MSTDMSASAGSPVTRRGLEQAALDLLTDGGLLAGFTLQQVGERAGVTKGLVYHYYGDRQTLLRSALRAGAADLQTAILSNPYATLDRRLGTFARAALEFPGAVQLMTILLIDGDPRLRTMPIRVRTMEYFAEDLARATLPATIDADAWLGVQNALVYGYLLFREGLARQMDVAREQLDARFRRLLPSLGRRVAQVDWTSPAAALPELQEGQAPDRPSTPAERLESAAIALLDEQGILAGLNLRTVATRAGVHRGLVYHYFGSRRELLLSALRRRLQTDGTDDAGQEWHSGRLFAEAIRHAESIRLMALLAIDGDDSYEPFGLAPQARLTTARMADVCVALGHALYRVPFAAESGIALDDWDRRVFAAWRRAAPE